MTSMTTSRPCAACGQFYPSDPRELRSTVRELLTKATPRQLGGRIRGIIAPHAGYFYSGLTAACAYTLLTGENFSTVVIISPSHRAYFDGVSIYSGESYKTPLGTIPVDTELRDRLLKTTGTIHASEDGHGDEHAVEVHLPFLQVVLKSFTFLPIVIGDQRREYCYALGEALGETLIDRNALLIASTDLSHYYPSAIADKLDAVVADYVKRFDYESLMRDLESRRVEACGGGPTVSLMMALSRLGVRQMALLHQCNSGDVSGDKSQVVGYLSAAAYE
jgi:MEMO1 family protein